MFKLLQFCAELYYYIIEESAKMRNRNSQFCCGCRRCSHLCCNRRRGWWCTHDNRNCSDFPKTIEDNPDFALSSQEKYTVTLQPWKTFTIFCDHGRCLKFCPHCRTHDWWEIVCKIVEIDCNITTNIFFHSLSKATKGHHFHKTRRFWHFNCKTLCFL